MLFFLGKLLNNLIWSVENSLKTLTRTSVFKIYEKTPVILLYWFSAQEQNSSLIRQKYSLLPSKFSVESSEHIPSFYNGQEVA